MSTENTSGDNSQTSGETPTETVEAFNVDNIISELTQNFEQSPTSETTIEPQGTSPVVEEQDTESKEASTEKELLSPLLAERSKREREARAEAEAARGSVEQARIDAKAEMLADLRNDPQGFITRNNIENAGDLAMHFYAADLGDEAPDDLKAQIGISDLDRYKQEQAAKLEELRSEMNQREILARNQTVINQYDGFLSDVPAELPYLAVEVKHDQQEVLKSMAQVADHLFEQTGQYPSATEVAKTLERHISSIAERYSSVGKPANVETPQVDQTASKQTQTLSTDHSGTAAKKSPVGEDELFEDALDYFEKLLGK